MPYIYRLFGGTEISLSRDIIFKEQSTNLLTATEVEFINKEEEGEINLKNAAEDEKDNGKEENRTFNYSVVFHICY